MKYDEFSGYILAGGKSSRMGQDKAFLRIGDKTFAENAVDILRPVCGKRIKFVINQNQKHQLKKFPANLSFVFDIYENRGPLGGIHSALSDCQTKWAIILAIDLPFVTLDLIKMLAQETKGLKNNTAVIPEQTDGRLQPLCAAFRNSLKPLLKNQIEKKENYSVWGFLKTIEKKVISSKFLKNPELVFSNINQPKEYKSIFGNKKSV